MGRRKLDTYLELGQLIRKKRKEKKLTVKQVCEKMGRPSDLHKVYGVERGDYHARLHFLEELIFILDCTQGELNSIGFKEHFESQPKAKDILKDILAVL